MCVRVPGSVTPTLRVCDSELCSYTWSRDINLFAVAVVKNFNVVGHVLMEYSESSGTLFKSVTVISSARSAESRCLSKVSSKGLKIPCEYIFTGQQKHIEKLISVFANFATGVASYYTFSLPAVFRANTLTKDSP